MGQVSLEVGKKITYYRKKRGMSVDELAAKICKGKSTLYKYTNGSIPIDVETLAEIAEALDIPMANLVDLPRKRPDKQKEMRFPFGKTSTLYIYNYVNKKLIKNQLNISYNPTTEKTEAVLYYDVPSFSNYTESAYLYHGEMVSFDFVTYIMMSNNLLEAEYLNICAFNPWKQNSRTWGFLFGIFSYSLAPSACKIMISPKIIPDEELLISDLTLTKEELRKLKNYNLFYLSQAQAKEQ